MTFLFALVHALDVRPDRPGVDESRHTIRRCADRVAGPSSGTRLEIVVAEGALVVSGDIDLSTRDLVTSAAEQLHRSCDIVVNAGGLGFIDAAGLGTLVSLSNRLAADGARLRVVDAPRGLRRLSELCGLDEVLGLEPVERARVG